MAKFQFYKLENSKWIESEIINSKKGRREAKKILEDTSPDKTKFQKGGIWKLRKIN